MFSFPDLSFSRAKQQVPNDKLKGLFDCSFKNISPIGSICTFSCHFLTFCDLYCLWSSSKSQEACIGNRDLVYTWIWPFFEINTWMKNSTTILDYNKKYVLLRSSISNHIFQYPDVIKWISFLYLPMLRFKGQKASR